MSLCGLTPYSRGETWGGTLLHPEWQCNIKTCYKSHKACGAKHGHKLMKINEESWEERLPYLRVPVTCIPPISFSACLVPDWYRQSRGARMTLSCHCFPTNALPSHSLFLSFLLPLCSFLGMAGCTKTGDCCCYRVKKKKSACVCFLLFPFGDVLCQSQQKVYGITHLKCQWLPNRVSISAF